MIGLLGGTFDPVHEGHIYLAKELLKAFPFKKIIFIPNAQNPLKKDPARATSEQRFQMLEAALKETGEPKLEVSRVEIDRSAPSFMIDTVALLQKQYQEPLVLILGNEVFAKIAEWKEVKALLETVSVLVVKRQKDISLNVKELLAKLHIFTRGDKFPWIREFVIEVLDFSSTEIREALKEAWKKDNLASQVRGIQRSVWLFIKVNQLYSR